VIIVLACVNPDSLGVFHYLTRSPLIVTLDTIRCRLRSPFWCDEYSITGSTLRPSHSIIFLPSPSHFLFLSILDILVTSYDIKSTIIID
jgi:hypothetical protein